MKLLMALAVLIGAASLLWIDAQARAFGYL
jgi:hypothetical protein